MTSSKRISDALASLRARNFLTYSPDRKTLSIDYEPKYRFKNDKVTGRPEPIVLKRYEDIIQRQGVYSELFNNHIKLLCPINTMET